MPKCKTENKTVEINIDMDINTYIVIPGIKFKFSSTTKKYGTSQLLQVLDEKQFQDNCSISRGTS